MTGSWTCPQCGEPLYMEAVAGQFFLLCPRRFDGRHFQAQTYTTNNTNTVHAYQQSTPQQEG